MFYFIKQFLFLALVGPKIKILSQHSLAPGLMGPKKFFASKKFFKLADARSTFDASIVSCGRCSGQIFKGKCYVNFTRGLLLGFYFFFIRSVGRRCPCTLRGRPAAGRQAGPWPAVGRCCALLMPSPRARHEGAQRPHNLVSELSDAGPPAPAAEGEHQRPREREHQQKREKATESSP